MIKSSYQDTLYNNLDSLYNKTPRPKVLCLYYPRHSPAYCLQLKAYGNSKQPLPKTQEIAAFKFSRVKFSRVQKLRRAPSQHDQSRAQDFRSPLVSWLPPVRGILSSPLHTIPTQIKASTNTKSPSQYLLPACRWGEDMIPADNKASRQNVKGWCAVALLILSLLSSTVQPVAAEYTKNPGHLGNFASAFLMRLGSIEGQNGAFL